jgi:Holliday junction DNA helicase RuvB
LSSTLGEEEATLEDVVEPYLLQIGFIERTPRGRKITGRAITHLEI